MRICRRLGLHLSFPSSRCSAHLTAALLPADIFQCECHMERPIPTSRPPHPHLQPPGRGGGGTAGHARRHPQAHQPDGLAAIHRVPGVTGGRARHRQLRACRGLHHNRYHGTPPTRHGTAPGRAGRGTGSGPASHSFSLCSTSPGIDAPKDLRVGNVTQESMMLYWSAPIAAFDHYRLSYRAAEGNRPLLFFSPALSSQLPTLPPSAGPSILTQAASQCSGQSDK